MSQREKSAEAEGNIYKDQNLLSAYPHQHVETRPPRTTNPTTSSKANLVDDAESLSASLANLRITAPTLLVPDNEPGSPTKETLEFATRRYHTFIHTSQKQHIDDAVAGYRRALAATPPDHPARPQREYLLASALICRYRNTDADLQDLKDGIELAERVASRGGRDELTLKAGSLQGWGYHMRYIRTGHIADNAAAVDVLGGVAVNTGSPERWLALLRLALGLSIRYQVCAGEELIARAEQVARDALLEDHPESAEPMLQDAISRVLYTKYRNARHPSIRDVVEAQEAAESAMRATPETHIHYSAYAQNRCRLYFYHMPHGMVAEEALAVGEKAFHLVPGGYRRRYAIAQAISNVSDLKTSRTGKREDLEEAMRWAQISVETPELHHKPTFEVGLCRWKTRRFEQYGQPSDVDTAIDTLRPIADGLTAEAVDTVQFARHYIVYAYFSRFRWHADERDLDESIRYAILSDESPLQGTREHETALARYRSCFERYKRKKSLEDLEFGLKKTLETIPRSDVAWHAQQPSDTWAVLADMYFCRYRELGEAQDFEQGVAWCHRVLNNDASAFIDKSTAMHLLAGGFAARADIQNSLDDLEQAISCAEQSAAMVAPGHALRSYHVGHLGDLYTKRYAKLAREDDLQEALDSYRAAGCDPVSVVKHRFRAGTTYAHLAHRSGRLEEAMFAYGYCIDLLPRLTWLGMDHESIFRELLSGASTLACDAAACACALGRYEQAIVLLEQGRAVFWQQQASLFTQNQKLLQEHPQLAAELQQIGRSLEIPTQAGNTPQDGLLPRRRLAERWDSLVEQIRRLEGFSTFLQPMTYEELREPLEHGGTPVFLFASTYGCAALIMTKNNPIRYVPLTGTSRDRLKSVAIVMHKAVSVPMDSLGTQSLERLIRTVINELWRDVGSPIWNVLSTLGLGPLPRVWWISCGVLGLLPVHAACPANPDEPGLPDLVTSSYVVLLQSLVRTFRKLREQGPTTPQRVLMVAQPKGDHFVELPSVKEELKVLRRTLPENKLVVLEDADASMANVTRALDTERWIHFACHGHQDQVSPLDSCLVLADGKLKLSTLIAHGVHDPNSFAFLSACHTARGFPDLPDEMLHIAAALEFAGFGSVVGSGWAIADRDAPLVTSRFYRYLTSEGQSLDPSRSAEALRVAVTALRRAGVPAHRWAPFLHLGR
ncbi:hypothetical protein CALVIDRAFT_559366 [Calocera viscosa TUFC12733]|uniref:CHAT domain-containing protein n=1 Tax=Calocera viscosa (strain TUFC12733) TaxID=1330018 RepID=A0A167S3P0_CALVF|nr:hypothetical protein CALVIDRAFT_559366 [Calocera viscosa TUFC12733]